MGRRRVRWGNVARLGAVVISVAVIAALLPDIVGRGSNEPRRDIGLTGIGEDPLERLPAVTEKDADAGRSAEGPRSRERDAGAERSPGPPREARRPRSDGHPAQRPALPAPQAAPRPRRPSAPPARPQPRRARPSPAPRPAPRPAPPPPPEFAFPD